MGLSFCVPTNQTLDRDELPMRSFTLKPYGFYDNTYLIEQAEKRMKSKIN